jgi:hypothetical protein
VSQERLSHIISVGPHVLKAVELSEKLDTLRQRRAKANALLQFCTDALRLALATKGIKI